MTPSFPTDGVSGLPGVVQLSGQRTYTVGGITAAQRIGNGTTDKTNVVVTDPLNGTITASITATTTMTVDHHYTDPYGNLRGTNTTWPGHTGYLNAPVDATTTLTRLGVRDYDPTLGRFLTVDPILTPHNPRQNNGYTYAHNNPITLQDPDGKSIDDAYASKAALCAHYGGCAGPTGHDCSGASCAINASGALTDSGRVDIVDFAVQSTSANLGHWVLKNDGSPEWKAVMGKYNRPGDIPAQFAVEMLYQGYPLSLVDQYYAAPCNYQTCHLGDPVGALICNCLIESPIQPAMVRIGNELSVSLLAGTGREALAAGKASSCLNSFTGGTPVLMADGSLKPIRDVKVGDSVLATDPETGQTKAEQVVQLIRHAGEHMMVLVTLANGSTLDSTDGHPIWDATQRKFIMASQLRAGDKIQTGVGQLITIIRLTTYSADLIAYNLQIDQIHTYYAGWTPVLVHNSCGPVDLRGLSTSYVKKILKRYDTDPHAFKEDFVGRGAVPNFDIKLGPGQELYLVNKDGSRVIPTGHFAGP